MGDHAAGEARTVILARIRSAIGPAPPGSTLVRTYRTTLPAGIDVVERFIERVGDYRAVVHRSSAAELPAVVARAFAARGVRRAVVPPGLPLEWLRGVPVEWLNDDPPLTKAQLDDADAVITGCSVAIAETGTIVLTAGPAQGRRALTLLPDVHVCVVSADQIVGDVPEALARLDGTRPLTWISGPSATSDIELNRIEGVHGPRKLDVIVVVPTQR
ncbi:LUD domain-containing protein [soil metagenome]